MQRKSKNLANFAASREKGSEGLYRLIIWHPFRDWMAPLVSSISQILHSLLLVYSQAEIVE
jgi:hypothetical protein